MYPKLRDILCFSILLGSALVSSQDLGPLDPQKVHDMVEDPTKTKEQKMAMANEMVQSLPMEEKQKMLAVLTDLIEAVVKNVKHTVMEIKKILGDAMMKKGEAVKEMKPMKRQARQSDRNDSSSESHGPSSEED